MPRAETPAGRRPISSLTSKGGETRQRILEAAAALIYERGAAATTIQQVRDAAGVSASQLYHYFADKQALVRAVVEYQGARMLAGQHAARIDSLDSLRRWRDDIIASQDQVLAGCPLGTLGSELADSDPSGRETAAKEFTQWETAIAQGLARIKQNGELPSTTDTDDLATALLTALQGGLLLAHITQTTRPLQKALDAMITVIETHATSGTHERAGSLASRKPAV